MHINYSLYQLFHYPKYDISCILFIFPPNKQLFWFEELRRHKLEDLATLIQKIYRGWTQRQKYLNMKHAQIIISSHYRGYRVCIRPTLNTFSIILGRDRKDKNWHHAQCHGYGYMNESCVQTPWKCEQFPKLFSFRFIFIGHFLTEIPFQYFRYGLFCPFAFRLFFIFDHKRLS